MTRHPRLAAAATLLAAFLLALALGAGIGTLALAACGTTADDQAPTTGPTVPWTDYAPGLQARLDAITDCRQLDHEFAVADANNAATRNRTGHNNADLLAYIDWLQSRRGCQP